MKPVAFMSITDQVAEHLRAEIQRGRWSGVLPGKHQLAAELGVNNKTVELALRSLEKAGLLVLRGAGRRRLINPRRIRPAGAFRIAMLHHLGLQIEKADYLVELLHALADAGYLLVHAASSLSELHFDPHRVARLVAQTRADAWIVLAGSRDVLGWFAQQPLPALALFGRRAGLRLAAVGPDKPPAMSAATRHLLGLGHRRIVLLCRKLRRLPQPGTSEEAFLAVLRAHGISVGAYNLPDWEEEKDDGFRDCLTALFRVTPPTALIVDEAAYFVAAMQFLLQRGIRVPDDVSLVCTDDDPAFSCCTPPIARITWDSRPVIRRTLSWAANVRRGRPDRRQTLTPAEFTPGGTTAPARESARRPPGASGGP